MQRKTHREEMKQTCNAPIRTGLRHASQLARSQAAFCALAASRARMRAVQSASAAMHGTHCRKSPLASLLPSAPSASSSSSDAKTTFLTDPSSHTPSSTSSNVPLSSSPSPSPPSSSPLSLEVAAAEEEGGRLRATLLHSASSHCHCAATGLYPTLSPPGPSCSPPRNICRAVAPPGARSPSKPTSTADKDIAPPASSASWSIMPAAMADAACRGKEGGQRGRWSTSWNAKEGAWNERAGFRPRRRDPGHVRNRRGLSRAG
eukprot:1765434-Rhodomonas_salina.1